MPIGEFFTGKKPSFEQVPTRSPQQLQTMQSLLKNLLPQAQQSFDFGPIAQGATQRFEQQTMPQISEAFGGAGAKRSSGYNQAIANAMETLQTQLAGQESQFGLQSQGNIANLLGMGLGQQFENVERPGEESPFATILPYLLHALAAFGTSGATVPISAAMLGAGKADTGPLQQFFGGGGG